MNFHESFVSWFYSLEYWFDIFWYNSVPYFCLILFGVGFLIIGFWFCLFFWGCLQFLCSSLRDLLRDRFHTQEGGEQ